ncbi:MAG: EF-P lysine aminoacylase EpmA [Woeseiaceae bacterium]|nr:EF-P lysine aminoacylase EpmA [Woeseiaceae bacterium]
MTDWRPRSDAGTARRRAGLKRRIRDYFRSEDVLEVDTPALSYAAGSDPNVDTAVVRSSLEPERRLFLRTSPEFCMKRLLAAGYPDIYSICRVFRDGEYGGRHQPEFTMVEWYRIGFSLSDMMADTCRLVSAALDAPGLAASIDTLDYVDAFQRYVGLDPLHASIDELAKAARADADLRVSLGGDRDAWLDLVLTTCVVPKFASDRLTALRHYPASQAALARLCPADPHVADRFEVFFGEIELANGYVELTDADEQLRRIEDELAKRQKAGKPVNPPDDALIAALRHGLPDCAGVALGLERLQMVADGTNDIGDVITFEFGQEHE